MVPDKIVSGVSALAFAAGLGLVIASNPAVASADTTESSSSDATRSGPSAADPVTKARNDESDDDANSDTAEPGDEKSSGVDDTDSEASIDDEEAPVDDEDTPADEAPETKIRSSSRDAVDDEPSAVDDIRPAATMTAALTEPAVVVQTAAAAQATPAADPIVPAAPPVSPWELFWAAARRTVVGAFYNQAPTIAPVELGQSQDALVTGILGAVDPDGDPLRFRITKQAVNGQVAVNADGTYVYTPNAAFAAAGGIDSFSIQVRDVGLRLFSPVRRVTVPVTVSVSPDRAPIEIAVGRNPVSVVISPDGSRAYVGGTTLNVIDTDTNTVIDTISTTGFQSALAISSNGKRLYSANSVDGTVLVIDTDHNVSIATITVGAGPRGLAIADDDKLYVANSNDGTVSVIDTATNTVVATITAGDEPRDLTVNHDGTRLYVANAGSNTVSVINTVTKILTATIDVSNGVAGAEPDAIVVSHDGARIYVANFGGSNVSVIDAATDKVVAIIEVDPGASPDALALSADGTVLYVANSNRGTLATIDLGTNVVTSSLTVGGYPAALAISGDNAYVASTTDATVTVLSLAAKPHDPPQKMPALGATRGFTVVNLTSQPLIFAGFSYKQGDSTSGPAVGSILQPGQSHSFDVTYRVFYETKAVVQYRYAGSGVDNYEATMIVEEVTAGKKGGCRARTGGDCSTSDTFYDDIDTIYFKDAKNTVVNVGAGDARALQILTDLCVDGSRASCSFRPKGSLQEVIGPRHQVGSSETNTTTDITRELTFTRSEQVSEQSSLKLTGKASAKIGALVTVEFSAEYGKTYTKTETFTKSEKINLPPRHGVAWTTTTPFFRANGDFTLVMGNTTFNVTGAHFDTPNPDGAGNWNLQDYPLPPVEASPE